MSSEPLSIVMAAGGMSVEDVLRIGMAIAGSLHAPHGELCPSAIALDDDGGVAVVTPGSGDRARYGQYAAPERIVGKEPTPSSDVFSIGALLYHALAGHPPFRGDSPPAVMLSICTEVPRPLPASVPREVQNVVMRCLAKEATQRYASPAELALALRQAEHPIRWIGKRVLAADDDAPIRELYAHITAQVGVEADIVATGRDAIEALKTRHYDVALLDLNMARLSGWEVLDFLRYRYEQRPRHLFIITGFSDQMISEADRDVVSAVLYKPVVPEELRTLVTQCLGGESLDLAHLLRGTQHRQVTLQR
jgi:CheY-like chemotaxis protein